MAARQHDVRFFQLSPSDLRARHRNVVLGALFAATPRRTRTAATPGSTLRCFTSTRSAPACPGTASRPPHLHLERSVQRHQTHLGMTLGLSTSPHSTSNIQRFGAFANRDVARPDEKPTEWGGRTDRASPWPWRVRSPGRPAATSRCSHRPPDDDASDLRLRAALGTAPRSALSRHLEAAGTFDGIRREPQRFGRCGDFSRGLAWLECSACDRHRRDRMTPGEVSTPGGATVDGRACAGPRALRPRPERVPTGLGCPSLRPRYSPGPAAPLPSSRSASRRSCCSAGPVRTVSSRSRLSRMQTRVPRQSNAGRAQPEQVGEVVSAKQCAQITGSRLRLSPTPL